MKIRQVGDELFQADRWADGQTDMTKLTVAFGNFANAPSKRTCTTKQYKQVAQREVILLFSFLCKYHAFLLFNISLSSHPTSTSDPPKQDF